MSKNKRSTITGIAFVVALMAFFFMVLLLWIDHDSIVDAVSMFMEEPFMVLDPRPDEVADDAAEAASGGIKELADEADELTTAVDPEDLIDETASEEDVEAPDAEDSSSDSPADAAADAVAPDEPEPIPDPEPGDDFVPFEMIVLGLLFKSREYYSTGTVAAGMNESDPYAFAKSSMPSMDIKLRTMPTDQFPGATPAEGLPVLFRERIVDRITDSGEWVVVGDPVDLVVNGLPAARMATEFRRGDDKTSCYHLTAIRGDTRSSFVYGSYGVPCPDAPGRAAEITAIADSVQLSEPGPVCSVGLKPDSDPPGYGVGCDYLPVGWVGVDALRDSDYTDIVLGPVTWDECAAFMREHDQPRW
ncbi:MAG: hypothetical protein MUQ30_07005 [Anaerolineae bacterium]|nr:hypothetical protein [Anaerolineae bacterium]